MILKTGSENIFKVVIIGPESTGKSTLCRQLAEHFQTEWVPEFAREYLEEHGMDYTYDDLLVIAKGQIELEEHFLNGFEERSKIKNQKSKIFIDTDMYVMKVWSEFVFGKCHHWVIDQIVERKYDLYLLCNIDLPWVPDKLREYPDLERREQLYRMYKDILVNQSVPWIEITGDSELRLQTAIQAVNRLQ